MRQSDPAVRNLTWRLLAHEAHEDDGQHLDALAGAAERAADTMRLHLSKVIGEAGFLALLERALVLAKAEHPWLAAVRAERDGSLKGLRVSAEGRESDEAMAGFAAVLAHVLETLTVFIGEDLTKRLVCQAWPEVSLDETGFDEEEAER